MKREPVDSRLKLISATWPVFKWQYCMACRREFRREWGWKRQGIITAAFSQVDCLCAKCCPTKQDFASVELNAQIEMQKRIILPKGGSGTVPAKNTYGQQSNMAYLDMATEVSKLIRAKPEAPRNEIQRNRP